MASLPSRAGFAAAGAGREVSTLTHDQATSNSPARAEKDFLPGPVLLLGAPGVGKGTQAQILMAEFGIPQISTGDILRDHIRRGTELGKTAKTLMDQGQLVPDDLVNDMVADRLSQPDIEKGYILDGFPRTLRQAEWLDAYLAGAQLLAGHAGEQDFDHAATLPIVAVAIKVDEAELLKRITGRRICSSCKHIYNIYFHPPKVEGVCDLDGGPLTHRSDDTEEAFAERMKAYAALTEPVITHYRGAGQGGDSRFREVDGSQSMEQVETSIVAALKELRERFPAAGR
jgi:adenylate kinase